MLWLVVQVLLVAYLPGALFFRLPGRSRGYRAALPADERLFWSVMLSVTWSTMVVILLGAVGRYSHDRLLIINAVGSALVMVALRQALRWPRPTGSLSPWALVPAGVVAFSVWCYFPPAEYIIGGRDPGTYINEGVQIAQRGELVLTDPIVSSVPPPMRDLFFPWHGTDLYYGLRFVGFFVQDPDNGRVVGQFPHFYPASIAIGYGLNGLSGARQTSGVWAMLGLLAIYFTGTRLFGRAAAGVAVALLAINVVTVWFARYPNAEVVMQAMLFATLLAFARGVDERQWFFPAVAGALLGSMLFLRYDTVLPIAACLVAATMLPAAGRRISRSFVVVLGVVGALSLWYLTGPMRAYMAYPLAFTRASGGVSLVIAAIVAWWLVPRLLSRPPIALAVRLVVPVLLAVGVIVLATYAYFFREVGGRTAIHDAMALRTYAWYVAPWMIGVAVAAYAIVVRRRFWQDPAFFLTLTTFAVFFFYKTRIVPEHFWASRRFLPMILPGTLLLAAALASTTFGPRGLPRIVARLRGGVAPAPRWAVPVGAFLLVAAAMPIARLYWDAASAVRHHVEYAGVIPRLEQLADRIGERDLLLVEGRNAGSDLHALAMPLAYIYAKQVLVLDSAVPSKRTLQAFLGWASSRYDNIWFLGGGGTDLLTARISAQSVASEAFQVPEYDAPINAYPHGVRRKEFEYGLYRLTTAVPAAPGPVDLQIGVGDDLNVVRFHAKERHADGTPFRWSGPQSYVLIQGIAPDAKQLTVWMSDGGRPTSAPASTVEVAIDAHVLGHAAVGPSLEPFTFDIPPGLVKTFAELGDPVRLRLRVATWQPSTVLGANDSRELGVMVTRVQVP